MINFIGRENGRKVENEAAECIDAPEAETTGGGDDV